MTLMHDLKREPINEFSISFEKKSFQQYTVQKTHIRIRFQQYTAIHSKDKQAQRHQLLQKNMQQIQILTKCIAFLM